jgi:hypothetical protein
MAPKISPPPPLQIEPVAYANPFDATEVFQFPSGTSETEARQLVAELLTERAREREDVWSRAKRPARSPRSRSYLSQTTIR